MAQKQAAPALVIVALLLFSAATPTAYGHRGLSVGLGPLAGGILSPVTGGILSPVTGGIVSPVTGGILGPVTGGVVGGGGGGIVSPLAPVIGGIVSPVTGGIVSPVTGGIVSPVGGGIVSPVIGGIVSPVIGGIVSPVTGIVSPVTGGIVSPVTGPVIGGIVSPVTGGIVSPVIGGVAGGALGLLNINGSVCCSPTGNCNATTPPLPGVRIDVICTNLTGASVVVGQGITGVDGFFFISIRNILTLIGNILNSLLSGGQLPCAVIVKLPVNQVVCPVLNATTTIIAGTLNTTGSVLQPVVNATVVYVGIKIGA